MRGDYLIVHKKILPAYYEKVVQAREMLRDGRVHEVSEAARLAGISRSTYYKYKDSIFAPGDDTDCRKAVFSLLLHHQKGVLSESLNALSEMGANILTISQTLPVHGQASVLLTADISQMELSGNEILERLTRLPGVSGGRIAAIE